MFRFQARDSLIGEQHFLEVNAIKWVQLSIPIKYFFTALWKHNIASETEKVAQWANLKTSIPKEAQSIEPFGSKS